MKRIISLVLALLLTFSIFSTAIAQPLTGTLQLEELYVASFLEVLKDYLLVPDSLTIRDIGCVKLSNGERTYYFFPVQYVAQNKLGGYSDDWIFAISNGEFGDDEVIAVLSADGDISYGDHTALSDLRIIMMDYLGNPSIYEDSKQWKDLPTDSIFYDP